MLCADGARAEAFASALFNGVETSNADAAAAAAVEKEEGRGRLLLDDDDDDDNDDDVVVNHYGDAEEGGVKGRGQSAAARLATVVSSAAKVAAAAASCKHYTPGCFCYVVEMEGEGEGEGKGGKGKKEGESSVVTSISHLDPRTYAAVRATYHAPWPLGDDDSNSNSDSDSDKKPSSSSVGDTEKGPGLLFPAATMRRYERLHAFFLRSQAVAVALRELWLRAKRQRHRTVRGLPGGLYEEGEVSSSSWQALDHRLSLFQREARCFCELVRSYAATRVLGECWQNLTLRIFKVEGGGQGGQSGKGTLRLPSSLSELRAAHEEYVSTAIKRCFLSPKAPQVMRAIDKVFACILELCAIHEAHSKMGGVIAQREGGTAGKGTGRGLRRGGATSAFATRLTRLHTRFRRYVKFLNVVLRKAETKGGGSFTHFRELLLRMDFNDFIARDDYVDFV